MPSLAFSVLDDAEITGGGSGSGSTGSGGKPQSGFWDSLGSENMLPSPVQSSSHAALAQSREAVIGTGTGSGGGGGGAGGLVGLGRASASSMRQPIQVSAMVEEILWLTY